MIERYITILSQHAICFCPIILSVEKSSIFCAGAYYLSFLTYQLITIFYIFTNHSQSDRSMNIESLHVSQLYQSVAAFGILILVIAEILACRSELWSHASAIRIKESEQEELWIKQRFPSEKQLQAGPDLEKSAIQSLRREMTEFESSNADSVNKNSQAPSQKMQEHGALPKTAAIEVLTQLNSSQKSTLLFYIEYNNFMGEHVPIIFSLLVLGMLTNSTRIFSLASFFCYLFCSLIFDFLHLEQRLKAEYKKGFTVKRLVKILSSCFIVGIFISYWALTEFGI